jgi:hypothetical protein
MVSVVHGNRSIPLYWELLDKQGQSSLDEQKAVLAPGFAMFRRYFVVVLGDREFHRVALAAWLRQQAVGFVLRLPKSTTVKLIPELPFERLDEIPQYRGIAVHEVQVQVPQQQGFEMTQGKPGQINGMNPGASPGRCFAPRGGECTQRDSIWTQSSGCRSSAVRHSVNCNSPSRLRQRWSRLGSC